jgi:hypothetical protein
MAGRSNHRVVFIARGFIAESLDARLQYVVARR